MSYTFPESDWKLLWDLRERVLDRFCERIVEQIIRLAEEDAKNWHERYLTIYKYIHDQDKELGRAFDHPRRSQALLQLSIMYSLELVSEEELALFSPQTREMVERLIEPQ